MPDKITSALMLDKARELRAAGWWTPTGFDQIKAACFSAADMLEQLAAEAKRPDPLGEALNMGDGVYRP